MAEKFVLPDLPYDFAALEPHISGRIMELHHDKHHNTYVTAANKALESMEEARRVYQEALVEAEVAPFFRDMASRLGAARVKQDLLIKGLSAEVIATAMAGLKSTELARARAVWRKKFSEPARDAAGRGKQMRFLVSRGFSADLVQRVLAGRDDESHNDCSDHSGV